MQDPTTASAQPKQNGQEGVPVTIHTRDEEVLFEIDNEHLLILHHKAASKLARELHNAAYQARKKQREKEEEGEVECR